MSFTVDTLQRLTNEVLEFEAHVIEAIEGFDVVYHDGNEPKREPVDAYLRGLADMTRAIRDASPYGKLQTPAGARSIEVCAQFADDHGFQGTAGMIDELVADGQTDEQIALQVLDALRSEVSHSADREGDPDGYLTLIEYIAEGRDL